MYIYTETGILKQKVTYHDIAEKCGKPYSISENGGYMLFRKSIYCKELHIVKISIHGLRIVSSLNIPDKVDEYFSKQKDKSTSLYKGSLQYWNQYCARGLEMENVKLSFCLNDNGDILINIKATDE
jgi:hypothetical protein